MKENNIKQAGWLRRKIEKRIEELIDQCRDIPPEEIWHLLVTNHENPDHNYEKQLEELFNRYRKKRNNEKQGP